MRKASAGTIVYIKRHALFHYDPTEHPRVVIAHFRKKSGNLVAVLDTGERVNFGELTDVPCSQMRCGDCIWHPKRCAEREDGR